MSANKTWKCVFTTGGAIIFSVVLLLTLRSGSPAGAEATASYSYYLPLVQDSNCWEDSIPSHGIQFYSRLDSSDGFYPLVDAGMRWTRVPLSWAAIEPDNTTPDNYIWSSLDYPVNNASQRGVHLILYIAGQPSWAATYAQGPVTYTTDIIEFVDALVERYDGDGIEDAPGSPKVRYFELYNEPDNFLVGPAKNGGWGYWGDNGAGYANLLRTLYPVVKAANPEANLVFGGIAMEPTGAFNMQFLDDVLAACQGKDCFDVMNFHYYPPFQSNWNSYGIDIIGKANYVKQTMATYGFEDKPVIVSETGYPSGVVWGDDERQSRYVVKVNTRAKAAGMSIAIWYKNSDSGAWDLPGLLDSELQPKPSYEAFENMAKMLEKANYQHTLTPAETGSDEIEGYSFQVCGQRRDVAWTEGDSWSTTLDDPSVPMTVQAETLRVSDKSGNLTLYLDEDDGQDDGLITVIIGGDPLFLEYGP